MSRLTFALVRKFKLFMTVSLGAVKWKLYAVHFAVYCWSNFYVVKLFILATGEQESEEESEALQVETNECGMQCSLQSEQHQSDSGTYIKLT